MIRIRGSVPLTYESITGFCLFCQLLTRYQQKRRFFKVFLLIAFWSEVTFTYVDKKSKRSHILVDIKVFLTFLACWWKDPGGPKIFGSYGIWIHNCVLITAVLYLFVSLRNAFQNMLRYFSVPPRFSDACGFFLGWGGQPWFFVSSWWVRTSWRIFIS
jgi:hypothetical protein